MTLSLLRCKLCHHKSNRATENEDRLCPSCYAETIFPMFQLLPVQKEMLKMNDFPKFFRFIY